MLALVLGCMFFALSGGAPLPGVLTGGNTLITPAISGFSGASHIVYSSQVPLTRTLQYTLTNNFVPFVGSDLFNSAVLARDTQPIISSSVSSVVTPGVVPQTSVLSSPVEVQKIDKFSEVHAAPVGGPQASGIANSYPSLNLDATQQVVQEPQTLETPDKIKEESANDGNDTSIVLQDSATQDSARDGPLQARSTISLETAAESTPNKGFPSAPRETYARYYTGPVIERS